MTATRSANVCTEQTLSKIWAANKLQCCVAVLVGTGLQSFLCVFHACSCNFVSWKYPQTQMGHFLYSAKAFDVLERLDPDPEYWEGKRGACVGVFQVSSAGILDMNAQTVHIAAKLLLRVKL